MTYLTNLAQYYTTYDYTTTSTVDPAAAAAVTAAVIGFSLVLLAVSYVIGAIFLGKLFKKAGVPSWIAWVPFYNTWKLLEIGGQQGFWAVLAIIPFVNYVSLVFMYIAMFHIGKKLGKEGVFVLLAIFLPIVWLIWLAVDKSVWNDQASTARSLHNPTPAPATPAA
jgi:hypothetical protein